MPADEDREALERLRRERDLYRRILDLGASDDIERFLAEVLRLMVDLTGAACGYIELYGPRGLETGASWSMSEGCDEARVQQIRRNISRGIVAAAIESGRTIITPSALLDERFRERSSVRSGGIEAVLCAPVGLETPVGVVYLESRAGSPPFDEEDRARIELFARQIAPLCDRLLVRQQLLRSEDPTRPWRDRLKVDGLVGRSRALAAVLKEAAAAAPMRDAAVLLTGESGTGKTHLARLIHQNSSRAGGPFVELNAATLPDALVESELFGAAPGGHSQASRPIHGKVSAAQGGTLFLDEIGELPAAAQAKLLQLLHSKEYYPLGAPKAVRADIRVIAATNSDLEEAVAAGRFRHDLYYRIEVLRIHMPALAERREDIPELAQHLCEQACSRNGLPRIQLSSSASLAAAVAEWPGNVRQLSNAVERAVARAAAEGVPIAGSRHLFGDDAAEEATSWQDATRQFQRELLARTLREENGNISRVAERLDMVRSHVYAMMKAFGLGRDLAVGDDG